MTNWRAVIIGFILAVFVKAFFGHYEFIGLLIVGFIVGYIAHSGVLGGLWNAAVAGAFGTIVSAILPREMHEEMTQTTARINAKTFESFVILYFSFSIYLIKLYTL